MQAFRILAVLFFLQPLPWAKASAPSWTLKDTQRLDGSILRLVCSGSGPSLGYARQNALDSCKVSAAQQLMTEVTVKSMTVTSESQAAFQQEVTNESQVSGLSCIPRHEEAEEGDAEIRLWLLCEFDLSKARIVHSLSHAYARDNDRRPNSIIRTDLESPQKARWVDDERKVLTLAVVPRCNDLIVRGGGPARTLPCGQNPISVVLNSGDREIILRASDYLPKTIYLGPQRPERGYAQVFLEPNP